MLRKWLIAGTAVLALAWAGVSPSFGAACTPATAPNTLGTTQNSVLELLESICSNASAVSVAGFSPSPAGARGTPVAVTTSDSSGNLPTGTVVVVSNAGTTNPMYCNVNGVAATTSDQYVAPSGGWFAFTIPNAVTTLHCIATGGSTTANMVGGSGLASGTGGGSGGAGAVTVANGADVTLGNNTDAASCASGTSLIACFRQFHTDVTAPVPDCGVTPCTNRIGEIYPLTATSTQTKVTIATASTYQQYLASNTSRKGCNIQFITAAHTGFVFFGAAPGDTTTSFQLSAGQTISCTNGNGTVLTDAIQLTSSNNSDVFVVNSF